MIGKAMKNKRKSKELNKEERWRELKRLFTTPEDQLRPKEFKTFQELWQRIDELVGRSTITHELAFPDLLYREILTGETSGPMGEALVKATELTKEKKAIIVVPQVEEGIPLGVKVIGKLDLSKKRRDEPNEKIV